jgi:hypothetical protein
MNNYTKYKKKATRTKLDRFIYQAIVGIGFGLFTVLGTLMMLALTNKEVDIVPTQIEVISMERVVKIEPIEIIEIISNYKLQTTELDLPTNTAGSFKTYMDYKTITTTTSKQWSLQQLATTDSKGFRRLNNDYIVAVGTFYSEEVGKQLKVTLDSGRSFTAIVGDIKQNRHTDSNNQYIPTNGNIIEFIVDAEVLDPLALKLGNVSCLNFEGNIISIEEVKMNE